MSTPFTSLYLINYTLVNPTETRVSYTKADNAIRALHTLQQTLDLRTLHRVESVSVSLYDSSSNSFVPLDLDLICKSWVEWIQVYKS